MSKYLGMKHLCDMTDYFLTADLNKQKFIFLYQQRECYDIYATVKEIHRMYEIQKEMCYEARKQR